jgi:hypothetical protein
MTESDLSQAVVNWIGMSYTASQWWLTVTTALIVATYFAAKHVRPWFFAIIILLYVLTALSAIFEVAAYGELAESYAGRLAQLRATTHAARLGVEPGSPLTTVNAAVNYAVFVLGTFSAVVFSFVHWRSARKT